MSCEGANTIGTEVVPPISDVFLGRGGGTNQKRQGSLYRKLVLDNFEEYLTLSALKKRAFAVEKIIHPITEKGGKFLVYHRGKKEWLPAQWNEVASKVMQALRDCKKETAITQDTCSASQNKKTNKVTEDKFSSLTLKTTEKTDGKDKNVGEIPSEVTCHLRKNSNDDIAEKRRRIPLFDDSEAAGACPHRDSKRQKSSSSAKIDDSITVVTNNKDEDPANSSPLIRQCKGGSDSFQWEGELNLDWLQGETQTLDVVEMRNLFRGHTPQKTSPDLLNMEPLSDTSFNQSPWLDQQQELVTGVVDEEDSDSKYMPHLFTKRTARNFHGGTSHQALLSRVKRLESLVALMMNQKSIAEDYSEHFEEGPIYQV